MGEALVPTSQNISVPNVERTEYQVVRVGDSGALSLLTPSCELKIDLNLPSETEEDQKVADAIKQKFENGKIIYVFNHRTAVRIGRSCTASAAQSLPNHQVWERAKKRAIAATN